MGLTAVSIKRLLRSPFRAGRTRSVLTTSAAITLSQILMAISGILSARALGPEGKGLVSGVLAWPMILAWAGLFGIQNALLVRVASNRSLLRDALGSALTVAFVSGVGVALIAVAFVPSAVANLGPDAEMLATVALAIIPLAMLSETLMSLNIALDRVQRANLARILGPILLVIATILLVMLDRLTPTLFVVTTLVTSMTSLGVLAPGLPWRQIIVSPRELIAELRFGLKIHLTGVLGLANFRLDILLMSTFVAASEIGYYSVANNVMIPVTALAGAAAILVTPAVARFGVDSGGQVVFIRREARIYVCVAAGGGVLLAIVSPLLVPLLFGPAFRPAVPLIWILIPGYIARALSHILVSGAIGMRRAWIGNAAEGTGLLLTLALLPILLPRYGATGAAITSSVAYIAAALVAWESFRRLAGSPSMAQPDDATDDVAKGTLVRDALSG